MHVGVRADKERLISVLNDDVKAIQEILVKLNAEVRLRCVHATKHT